MPYTQTVYDGTPLNVTIAKMNHAESGIAANDAEISVGGSVSRKPGSSAGVAYVDPAGNDSNDGLSWGTAKATIAAAITGFGAVRGKVRLSSGTHSIGTAVSVPNYITVEGSGRGTLLRCTGNNYAFNFNPANHVKVSNLTIDAASVQSSGGGFDFTNAANNIWISDIWLGNNLHTSFNLRPAAQGGIVIIDRVRWLGVTGCTYGFHVGDGANLISDIYVSNAIGTAASSADMDTWVRVNNSVDTLDMSKSLFYQGSKGYVCTNTGAGDVTNCKNTSVIFDNMDLQGVLATTCRIMSWSNCSVQGCGTSSLPGIKVGASAKAFSWVGGHVHQCRGDGVSFDNGSSGTMFDAARVLNNNTSNQTLGAGYSVTAGASNWSILGGVSGNELAGITANQKYGILVGAGASDNVIVQGVRLPGNVTAPYDNVGITGQNIVWRDNIPGLINTIAAATALVLPPGDVVTVTGNTTVTSIGAGSAGVARVLVFTGTPTVTDGSNLKLAGNLVATADDTLSLVCDGTNWIETARSVN